MLFQQAPVSYQHISSPMHQGRWLWGCPDAIRMVPDCMARGGYRGEKVVPIVIAAAIWGRRWSRSHVCFHSDYMAVVAILQSNSPR